MEAKQIHKKSVYHKDTRPSSLEYSPNIGLIFVHIIFRERKLS